MAGNLVSLMAVTASGSKDFRAPETKRPVQYWDVHWVNNDHHCTSCGLHFHSRKAKKNLECPFCGAKIPRAAYGSKVKPDKLKYKDYIDVSTSETLIGVDETPIMEEVVKHVLTGSNIHTCKHCGYSFHRKPGGVKYCPECNQYLEIRRGRPKTTEDHPNTVCKHCGHSFYRKPGGTKKCPSCKKDLGIRRGRKSENINPIRKTCDKCSYMFDEVKFEGVCPHCSHKH